MILNQNKCKYKCFGGGEMSSCQSLTLCGWREENEEEVVKVDTITGGIMFPKNKTHWNQQVFFTTTTTAKQTNKSANNISEQQT